jgi:1,4-alpha-glucan branching enzyme
MNPLQKNKYNAASNLRAVNFMCDAPAAQTVTLVGDFNHWNEYSHPFAKQPDGGWLIRVELKHGHHRYAFLVDGVLTLDPRAMGITRDDLNRRVSLIPVS